MGGHAHTRVHLWLYVHACMHASTHTHTHTQLRWHLQRQVLERSKISGTPLILYVNSLKLTQKINLPGGHVDFEISMLSSKFVPPPNPLDLHHSDLVDYLELGEADRAVPIT